MLPAPTVDEELNEECFVKTIEALFYMYVEVPGLRLPNALQDLAHAKGLHKVIQGDKAPNQLAQARQRQCWTDL